MPQGGMEGECRAVIGCTQPDGWKITSANPKWGMVPEWRWFLRQWGCLTHYGHYDLRSQSLELKACTLGWSL